MQFHVKAPKTAAVSKKPKAKTWQKTHFANLIRYVPSGVCFCRIRVRGQLIRKSLKTDVLSVAKLRLGDEEKKRRQTADSQTALQRGRGEMTFGEALTVYRGRLAANKEIKSKTKDYYRERVDALLRTWSGLEKLNVGEISRQDCEGWAAKFKGRPTAFNNTVIVLRSILDICVEHGAICENAANKINKLRDSRRCKESVSSCRHWFSHRCWNRWSILRRRLVICCSNRYLNCGFCYSGGSSVG